MTEMHATPGVPEWDLADRLGKSLKASGVAAGEMAEYLDVHRNTISRYVNGHGNRPDKRTLRLWALRTGVPLEWLEKGITSADDNDGGDDGERARQDSNLRPRD